jgi:hypothetical protein
MAEHELWRGEAAERYRIMDAMEEDRAAREQHALRSADPRISNDEEYRRRLDEQWRRHQPQQNAPANHRGRGPKGYQRSDERIADDLNERLTNHRELDAREIQVSVTGAEVTLSGVVESRSARRLTEDIAESVLGVRHVMNNLRVR